LAENDVVASAVADPPVRSPRPYPVRRWTVTVLGGSALVFVTGALPAAERWRDAWGRDPYARPVLVAHLLATAIAIGAGIWMTWRRPANPCGPIAVLLGVVFGCWLASFFVLPEHGQWRNVSPALVTTLRPLLFFLVLAFPIGRLDRVSRRTLAIVIGGSVAAWAVVAGVRSSDPEWPAVMSLWDEATWTRLANSAWWDVGGLFTAAAVLVIVHRRGLRFRTLGDHVGVTAFWAALIATGADFVLIGAGPVRELQAHDGGLTPFGMGVQLVDYLRWGVVIALLAVAARRAWPAEPSAGGTIDLDEVGVGEPLRVGLAKAIGDPDAAVAVRDASSNWIDLAGRPRAEPGIDRAATVVTQDGEEVAALEYDEALAAHPAVIDAAVAALALELESARQLARARSRERELRQLARDVIAAEDDARGRLERDLHDGAQQALVGVTLQAALAARTGTDAAGDTGLLADAIDDVIATLQTIASGRPPALLAERGLEGALGALAATAGIPVTVDIDRANDLADSLQRAVWFTASEAVTNALKHARASHLRVTLRRSSDALTLTVADDGVGGVADAPAALRQRIDDVRGRLHVDSDGSGTVVRATFPLVPAGAR
jgi:signal transduction histidine kinase